jgi:rare lipoprotein A
MQLVSTVSGLVALAILAVSVVMVRTPAQKVGTVAAQPVGGVMEALQAPAWADGPAKVAVQASPTKPVKPLSDRKVGQVLESPYLASWYGPGFHGNLTANGEIFDQAAMTAAHKDLPFGTELRITNVANGRSVVVRVNDRGPYIDGREVDLSHGAAAAIGGISMGVIPIQMEVLNP